MTEQQLVNYKDGYRTLRINPKIKVDVINLDAQIDILEHRRERHEIIAKRKRERLEKGVREALIPYVEKIQKINIKLNELEKKKRDIIEGSCTHKTHMRWTGGDYNERLIKECLNCDKNFGEVD